METQPSVRVRREEEDGHADDRSEGEDVSTTEEVSDHSDDSSTQSEEKESKEDSRSSSVEEESRSSLKDISFGALARAQRSFAAAPRLGKRKHPPEEDAQAPPPKHKDESRPSKLLKPSRSSKHAPQTLSTRYAVSRRRTILELPRSLTSRDPRFDPAVTSTPDSALPLETEKANKNYSFLTDYRQSELQTLQAQLKALQHPTQRKKKSGGNTNPIIDAQQIAHLKREIQSLSAKLASSETMNREREIRRAHKHREKEAIREGRKSEPYFLKRGDVRKEIEREREEGMGKQARQKRDLRRQKRQKGKEGREMPRFRRDVLVQRGGVNKGRGGGRGCSPLRKLMKGGTQKIMASFFLGGQ